MKWLLIVVIVALVVAQFVRPTRANPPIDEKQTMFASGNVPADVHAILQRSCNDCHSNAVVWPWYSEISPISWLVAEDVKDGRKELNLSTWGTYTPRRQAHKLEEICDQVQEGEMPLKEYLYLHGNAKLSAAEKQRLCEWTSAFRAEILAAHPEAARRK